MTSQEWKKLHPERWKAHQLKYRLKKRNRCRVCDKALPFPSAGRKYHDECRPNNQKKHRQIRLAKLAQYKLEMGCSKCGYNRAVSALHFHHLDPTQKETRVWQPSGNEFNKCILLCANCHFEIHENTKIEENGDVYE